MAIQTLTLDPTATGLTDDQIVSKINNATSAISRTDALDYDALNIVITGPPAGHFKVKKVDVDDENKLSISYDDTPVT